MKDTLADALPGHLRELRNREKPNMYRHPCHRGLQRLFVTCQLHLVASGAGTPTINHTVTALRFLFIVTLRKPQVVARLPFIREPRKLPVVLSPEEVARLRDAAPGLKYKAALSVAYGAGLRASEIISLKVADIDSTRMVIRIEQGKGRKDRYVMLSQAVSRA